MERITVDITATLSRNRLTGVQRVVHNLLEEAWEDVDALRYSAEKATYVRVSNRPRLEHHPQSRWSTFLAGLAYWLWHSSASVRLLLPFREKLNALARKTYGAFLSPFSAGLAPPGSERGSEVPKSIWLLDVPTDTQHLRHLRSLVERGTQLSVYLYDLIPAKTEEEWSEDLNPDQKIAFQEYLELVLKAKTVLCLSRFTRDEYLAYRHGRGDAGQNVSVLYPPLQLQGLCSGAQGGKTTSVAAAGYRNRAIRVMAVAPLLRRKNLRTVLLALEEIASNASNEIHLILVCPASASVDTAAWQSLQRLKKMKNARVVVLKDISDGEMGALLRSVDGLVCPSLYEGLGLPILEATSMGVCVIASDIPVFRELHQCVNFRMVPALSTSKWKQAILELPVEICRPQKVDNFFPTPLDFLSELREQGS